MPYVWGEFEVDCTTNTVTGVRQDLVDQLTRAYVRAAPGRLVATTYDPQPGALTASGEDAPAGAELLVFYPIVGTANVVLSPSGLDDVRLVRDARRASTTSPPVAVGGAWHSLSPSTAASLMPVSARQAGIEPATRSLEGCCSIH